MSQIERDTISENIIQLVNHTSDVNRLKIELLGRDVLSRSEIETIFSKPETDSILYELYDVIPRKGPIVFQRLITCLKETNNEYVSLLLSTAYEKRKRNSSEISSGDDEIFVHEASPKRCRLDRLATVEESEDEDDTAICSHDFYAQNGQMRAKSLLKKLKANTNISRIILKEILLLGPSAEKVYLPKLREYLWQNDTTTILEDIDLGSLLLFYTDRKNTGPQYTDLCSLGVKVEINFANKFVILSNPSNNFLKVGGNRLLEEIGKGGLCSIFKSVKYSPFYPQKVEIFEVNISRCPFPPDSFFLIKELCIRDVTFSSADVLQKTIETCPELIKLEIIYKEFKNELLYLDVIQSGRRDCSIDVHLCNVWIDSRDIGDLEIKYLKLTSCVIPDLVFANSEHFRKLETIEIENCKNLTGENILDKQNFLASLLRLPNLKTRILHGLPDYEINLHNGNNFTNRSVNGITLD